TRPQLLASPSSYRKRRRLALRRSAYRSELSMHEPSTAHAVPHAHAGTLARWKAAVRRSPLGPVLRPVYRTLRAWDSVGFAVGVLLAVGALVAAIADALNVAVAAMALATILVALSLLRRVSYQQRSARALAQEAGSRGAHRLLGDLER